MIYQTQSQIGSNA